MSRYRHRLGLAPGYPQYADVEAKLAALPVITVPTVTLDGEANGIIPASDGRSSATKFSGRRNPPSGSECRPPPAAAGAEGLC
jgi:hypothetical protein